MNRINFVLLIFILLFNYIYSEKIPIVFNQIDERSEKKNKLPDGFMLVDENVSNGPITNDREKDDGTKRNLYKNIRMEDDSFYYNYKNFDNLNNNIPTIKEYFCEIRSPYRPEALKGYDISCPAHYTIKIDDTFYGRFKKDKKHCKFIQNEKVPKFQLITKKNCGYSPIKYLKELCEGKKYCTIIPTHHFLKNFCGQISKYLYVEYHCVKDSILEKENICIVSFYNGIDTNSLEEHSVSEFYQYANIHGYEFHFEKINYSPSRQVYFMKFYIIIEKLIEGLKYKKYDWIFWVDSDVLILNPNIKLEAFLPNETMSNIHLLAAYDYYNKIKPCCGLNSGVMFIRVHEWSLNLLMRAISYPYFNKEKIITYYDQTSLNNILIESNETDHYIIFPQQFFNNRHIKKGEFLFHNLGEGKEQKNKRFREFLKNFKSEEWDSKTNEETRQEVLNYYSLPKEKQMNIIIQP